MIMMKCEMPKWIHFTKVDFIINIMTIEIKKVIANVQIIYIFPPIFFIMQINLNLSRICFKKQKKEDAQNKLKKKFFFFLCNSAIVNCKLQIMVIFKNQNYADDLSFSGCRGKNLIMTKETFFACSYDIFIQNTW